MLASPHYLPNVKSAISILLLSAAWLMAAAGAVPGLFRVRTMVDSEGAVLQLGVKPGTKAVVLVFLGPECPVSQRYVPELNRIASQNQTNAVEFYGVVAGKKIARTNVAAFAKEYAIHFPVLVDDDLSLARWLRPTHMPEAFVLKVDGDVIYHGRIDDWYESIGKPRAVIQQRELRDAITAVLSNSVPARVYARPVGCYFEEIR
jgi:hypothetical protein